MDAWTRDFRSAANRTPLVYAHELLLYYADVRPICLANLFYSFCFSNSRSSYVVAVDELLNLSTTPHKKTLTTERRTEKEAGCEDVIICRAAGF